MSSSTKLITPTIRQTWVATPVFLNKLGMGMSLGFASCLLASVRDPHSDIHMDLATSSWFVSSFGLSWMIGFIVISTLMAHYGRRVAYVINCVPAVVGWFVICFASNVPLLILGRVFTGITVGGNSMLGAVVIAEYSSPKNRGMFLNLTTAGLNLGSLLVHVVGNYVTWRCMAAMAIVPFMGCLIIAYTWPESPSWLAERKEYEKSEKVFYWLRGKTEESTRELVELQKAQIDKKVEKTVMESIVDFLMKFKKKNFWKPVIIIITSMLLLESSGRRIFPSYATQIIEQMTSSKNTIFYYTIILDVAITISGFSASYLIRIFRLRQLLFSTGALTFVALNLACLFLYLVCNELIPKDYSMVPLVFFALFFALANLSCTSVPLAMIGEIFPLEHRAVGSAVSGYSTALAMSISLKAMPSMVAAFSIHGAFAILGVCLAATLIVLYFMLPETTNRSLQEIEDYFNYGKFRDEIRTYNFDHDSEEKQVMMRQRDAR